MKPFRVKKPFVFTIFGASGDLAKLKIFPALYALAAQKRLPKKYFIVGYARTSMTQVKFKKEFAKSVQKRATEKVSKKILDELLSHVYYYSGQYNKVDDFKRYRAYLDELTNSTHPTHITYFAVPPVAFQDIVKGLGESRTNKKEDLRLVLEKPFGDDRHSARELFYFITRYFKEEQIYLLDHYLGKNAVQSILNLRHSNRLLNLMMKGPEVSNIQITACEDIGIAGREGYFDRTGIVKDMVQSHLTQILALITMSIPITDSASSLHREKLNILSAIRFETSPGNIVLGQYESYKKENNIPKSSRTCTFAALRMFIDRESWFHVPIYIRTGKMLSQKRTYIVIELKKFGFQPEDEEPNRVIIELQPEERINITFVNTYGKGASRHVITTSESIACTDKYCLPEHASLLLDVIQGDKLHFLCFPEVVESWKIADAITRTVKKNKVRVERYKDKSRGPASQDKLLHKDGFSWYDL